MAFDIGNVFLLVKGKPDEASFGEAGRQGGGFFGDSFRVAAGNLMADAARQLGGMVANVFSEAFSSYSSYEQLVGGVDTLFKDSSEKVQQYAANAYQTAGMSANEYMEQVTSFSASLLKGLGGDTDKAADYADMAMRDMSDNANKMGTSMEAITNAYQGFAKQNYTMLDNLKLGYGGTKTEMERLLKDASEIAGVEFNIDSYNDVIEAIHVMQTEMDISGLSAEEAAAAVASGAMTQEEAFEAMGTTAKEATTTIEGSMKMMSASWQNLLTGLFDKNADIGALVQQLMMSLGAVAKNVFPAVASLVANLVGQLPGVILSALKSLPSLIGPTLDEVFGEEVGGKVTGHIQAVVDFLMNDVAPFVQRFIDTITPIIQKVGEVVATVMPYIGMIIQTVFHGISAVTEVTWPIIETVVTTVLDVIKGAIEGIATVVGVVADTFNAIKEAITNPIETAKNVIKGIVDAIKGFFSFKIEFPHIPLPHFVVNPPGWQLGDLLKGQIPSLGIDWYAKGGIVDDATLIGAGEAGPEAIVPLTAPNLAPFADAVADRLGGRGQIYIENMTVEADDVDELIMSINRRLAELGAM